MAPWQLRLLDWYWKNARRLPWRQVPNPYRIWVSEVMLQQTQVATVLPYYHRWLARFPTLKSLAESSDREVLRLWAGLGYYRRARNLHAAARRMVGEHQGRLPKDIEALRSLPGIGRYTAAAIASIAFGQAEAVLDGNVARVLSRLYLLRGSPARNEKRLWALAEKLLPKPGKGKNLPGDWNQAVMELGATVCLPRDPLCPACPVRASCRAYRGGLQDRIPGRSQRREPRRLRWTCLECRRDGRLLLQRRGPGLLSGHWGLPELKYGWARSVQNPALARTLRHSITHHRIEIRVLRGGWRGPLPKDWAWVREGELEAYLISSLWRKALGL